MKKFFSAMFVALIVLVGGNVLLATSAQATSVSSPTSVAQVATAKSSSITPIPALVAPGKAVTAPFNLAGGGGGVKPAWLYVSCYWAMNGYYYCWRYSCTYFEKVALGCYEGWYRVSTVKFV